MTKPKGRATVKFKVGDIVEDTWYPYIGVGTVEKVLKTRIHVRWHDPQPHLCRYDLSHTQFLRKAKNGSI